MGNVADLASSDCCGTGSDRTPGGEGVPATTFDTALSQCRTPVRTLPRREEMPNNLSLFPFFFLVFARQLSFVALSFIFVSLCFSQIARLVRRTGCCRQSPRNKRRCLQRFFWRCLFLCLLSKVKIYVREQPTSCSIQASLLSQTVWQWVTC